MTDLPDLLRRHWGLAAVHLEPLDGGMNSETWLVDHEGNRYVAKRVAPAAVADLVAGAETAATLARHGLVTGAPVPTTDGSLVLDDHGLALLLHVPGRELTGATDEEQRRIARTLATAHLAGAPAPGPSSATFQAEWLTPARAGVAEHPWLVAAIDAVRAETDDLTLTWSTLHTDPAPEAFVHDDATGVTGLIDWAGAKRGPVLYDVASAVMYLGGPESAAVFLTTYQQDGPLAPREMELLDAFRRLRWAVQGAYFAWRLATDDHTGGVERSDNERGLDHARTALDSLPGSP
ncbi:phosphotransferase enzyme family protein [Nocardioides iriomotensis]|uniref:Aminoglycoside phosphotransferase domain-containing protein n=1 Tax=Nocardioides iriomotensis TaxID=715784 RepID=A0A4Q5J0Q1_9ACTN|nr:phosphotransferase [Nocardioides iriomotensis]RYU10979.1 hypothetical protein ETU37_14820 [Nocardioides iriomotensis]